VWQRTNIWKDLSAWNVSRWRMVTTATYKSTLERLSANLSTRRTVTMLNQPCSTRRLKSHWHLQSQASCAVQLRTHSLIDYISDRPAGYPLGGWTALLMTVKRLQSIAAGVISTDASPEINAALKQRVRCVILLIQLFMGFGAAYRCYSTDCHRLKVSNYRKFAAMV